MTHRLAIDHWLPARLNEIMWCHWRKAARRKKSDKKIVTLSAIAQRLPVARGKRRVDLRITLGPRGRKGDAGNWWKSVEDALVHARLLVDDSPEWYEQGEVTFERGKSPATVIELTDL
jgi:hypothetical protein